MASFLDQVVGNIAKGVDSAKEGSKLFIEKAKINNQIQDIEREKNQLIINMGNLVYNLQSSGEINIEQCSGICQEITHLSRQIIELQEQVKALDVQKPTYYSEQNIQQPTENGVRCQCGYVNKGTAKFCAKCGQPLI